MLTARGHLSLRAVAALGLVFLSATQSQATCERKNSFCQLDGGHYYAAQSERHTKTASQPAMIYLHGFGGSARKLFRNKGFVRAWTRQGILLVLPNATKKEWAHVGSPNQSRDDLAFLDSVVRDVNKRFSVSGVWVSGFSQGGSMVWDLACHRSTAYEGFFPSAGAFWNPLPAQCGTPRFLRHTHGLRDRTVPIKGRRILKRFRQGDMHKGFSIFRAANGCEGEPDRVIRVGRQTCRVWTSCTTGTLELCLHPGGHSNPRGWLARTIATVKERTR